MGAPKKARMPSPISRATVPSYLYAGLLICSNAPWMISDHSSGSRRSAAAVEPLTSQKSMVTTRRSPTISPRVRADSSLVSSSFGMYCWSWDSRACDDGEAEGGGGCGGGGGAAAGWEAGEETAVAGGGLAGRGATAGFTPGVCAVAVWAAGRQMKPPESTSLSPQLSQKFVA